MTDDTLALVGRSPEGAITTHAARLRRRGAADRVRVLTYDRDPGRELREAVAEIDADRAFLQPLSLFHTRDTLTAIPGLLSAIPGRARYCEPLGYSTAVTRAIAARGGERLEADEDAAVVLAALGSSSAPHHREATEYQARRLRRTTEYGEVRACYLVQNPAVECVRYNVSADSAVVVPLFAERCAATAERIPEKLELDRGGLAYADPPADHPLVTDAIEAELEKQRVFADSSRDTDAAGAVASSDARPVATDGEGR